MRKIFLTALTISALVFTGCSLDDDDNTGGNTQQPTIQDLSGNLTSDLRLVAGTDYNLNGALFVKSGATLTIDAGVTINALAGGTDVYILVERGGTIIADGTAANPIVFTSNASSPQAGDWGGLIILGDAPINSVTGAATATSEIASLPYGGTDATDNSGIIRYLRVQYSGGSADGQRLRSTCHGRAGGPRARGRRPLEAVVHQRLPALLGSLV